MMRILNRFAGPVSLPICHYGDPVLKERSAEITVVDAALREFAGQMIAAMHDNNGIGLAAPQVGRSIRLVALDVPFERDADDPWTEVTPGELELAPRMPLVLVNPRLSNLRGPVIRWPEGCLSVPGLSAPVERPEFATLDSELLDGSRLHCEVGGLLARCLQHEIDHLDGRLFIEIADPEALAALEPELEALRLRTRRALKNRHRRR